MGVLTLLVGLFVVLVGLAVVFGVLGFVLYKVRASGRSASRGRGTGEGGTAFHAGTHPGPGEFATPPAAEDEWRGYGDPPPRYRPPRS